MDFKTVAIAVVVGVAILAGLIYVMGGSSATAEASRGRVFIDATTGETFRHEIEKGETIPVVAPSGNETGFEAEPCYWTAEGGIKEEPTYVLLNRHKGEPEPTFCPDCDRLVVGLNPPAMEGATPPRKQTDAR
jgi:hypothetical protein